MAKVQEFIGHSQAIYSMCLGANTNELYSTGADCSIIKWNLTTANGKLFAKLTSPIYSIFYDEDLLYVGTSKGEFFIFNTIEKKLLKQEKLNCGGIFSIVNFENKLLSFIGNASASGPHMPMQ